MRRLLFRKQRETTRQAESLFPEDAPLISAGALLGLVEAAPEFGYPGECVLDGLPHTVADLRRRRARISWADLATGFANLERAGITAAELEEMGAHLSSSPFLLMKEIGRFFVRPEHLLYAGMRWIGPSAFPPIHSELDYRGREISLRLWLPASHRSCAAYFHVCAGTLAAVPMVIGHPPATVHATIGPREATYDIRVAPLERGILGLRRIVTAMFSAPQVIHVLADQQDELRASYEENVRHQRQFRAMIDALPDGVIIHRGDAIAYVNPVVPALLGYENAADLYGTPWTALVHPDDRDHANGGREVRFQRTDGSSVVLELSRAQSITFEARPAEMLVARDVTERRALQARLAMTDKMASLGTIAAGVAHEINNPLTLVMSNLDLAARADVDGRIRDLLAVATDGAMRVRDIVGDLRLFSRPEEEAGGAPRQRVSIAEVVASTAALARGQVSTRARLDIDIGDVPPVHAHRGRVGQVLLNLILNALHALPNRPRSDNRIEIRAFRDGDDAVITVADNGSGIPSAIADHVFEPFFSTREGGGSGLGLAVAHSIVTGYGGSLSFHTARDDGTTFRVALPAAEADAEASTAPAAPLPDGIRRGRILVVDDEPAVTTIVARALADEHEVLTASSGNDAIRLLACDGAFDAILCDIMMRDGSGADVHAYLERDHPQLCHRLVFMTGGTYRPETRTFMAQVGNPCLSKPFSISELLDLVSRTVANAP